MESISVRGIDLPALGFGTARMRGRTCRNAVERALAAGYRHLDTAQMYGNEEMVGDAVAASEVPREEVFLTTKLNRGNLSSDDVLASTDDSRRRLGVETIDLLLVHAPSASVPVRETVEAMNELQAAGTVRHIGVSNFSVAELEEAMTASRTPVLTNQVEYNPYTDRSALLEFCLDEDVLLTAYSPLARGRVADDRTLAAIGDRYGKTAAQVALRWLLQQPLVAPIPKAADPDHVAENAAVFDFELTDAEMVRVFEHGGGLVTRLRTLLGL